MKVPITVVYALQKQIYVVQERAIRAAKEAVAAENAAKKAREAAALEMVCLVEMATYLEEITGDKGEYFANVGLHESGKPLPNSPLDFTSLTE